MKLLDIIPSPNIGGVQKLILSISQLDKQYGLLRNAVCIISDQGALKPSFNNSKIEIASCCITPEDKGLRPYFLIKRLRQQLRYIFIFRFIFFLFKRDEKIVCSHESTFLISQVVATILTGKKFVWFLHTEEKVLKYPRIFTLIYSLFKSSISFIAVSKAAANNNLKYLFEKSDLIKKLEIISGGINLDNYTNAKNTRKKIREKLGYDDDILLIGSVGRLHWSKGYDTLIESISNLVKLTNSLVRFLIAGEGPERTKLEQLIEKYNLKKKVQLLGNIDYVPQLLGCLDIYVQPSISEGFGLSVIEAMAAKIPVICTDAGGLREIIINNKTGIVVKKNDSKSLCEGILQLLACSHRVKNEFVQNANKNLYQYSDKNVAEKLYQMYKKL